jgi:hypothetical protein
VLAAAGGEASGDEIMSRPLDRGLHYRRTQYAPGLGVCTCGPCAAAWRDRTRCGDEPKLGEPFAGCVYVNREKVFSASREKEAAPSTGFNYGFGVLQDLMVENRPPGAHGYSIRDFGSLFKRLRVAFKITARDRVIVATVIQWLGTTCGFCWLEETLKACGWRLVRIEEKAAAERRAA